MLEQLIKDVTRGVNNSTIISNDEYMSRSLMIAATLAEPKTCLPSVYLQAARLIAERCQLSAHEITNAEALRGEQFGYKQGFEDEEAVHLLKHLGEFDPASAALHILKIAAQRMATMKREGSKKMSFGFSSITPNSEGKYNLTEATQVIESLALKWLQKPTPRKGGQNAAKDFFAMYEGGAHSTIVLNTLVDVARMAFDPREAITTGRNSIIKSPRCNPYQGMTVGQIGKLLSVCEFDTQKGIERTIERLMFALMSNIETWG